MDEYNRLLPNSELRNVNFTLTLWYTSLSSRYLNTVIQLASLSSSSASEEPLELFFSKLSQYFASWKK